MYTQSQAKVVFNLLLPFANINHKNWVTFGMVFGLGISVQTNWWSGVCDNLTYTYVDNNVEYYNFRRVVVHNST